MEDDFDLAQDKIDSKEKLTEDLKHYRNVLLHLGANVPLGVLCLPPDLEKILLNDGCIRVYDLISRDLAEIKGIGKRRLALLTSRLDEFLTINL